MRHAFAHAYPYVNDVCMCNGYCHRWSTVPTKSGQRARQMTLQREGAQQYAYIFCARHLRIRISSTQYKQFQNQYKVGVLRGAGH